METEMQIMNDWEEQKNKLMQKFSFLVDKDLLFIDGKKELMMSKLEIKLSKTKEELIEILNKI